MKRLPTTIRKILVIFGATTLLLGGIAMLILPGPGLLVIIASLLLLGTEYEWAKRLSLRLKSKLPHLPNRTDSKDSKTE